MIEVRDLQYTYPGNKEKTLLGLDFVVRPGEIFGFLGPSGAGKSTTQNILVGILKGYAGSVKVLGQELAGATPDYYERIGVSFELPNLYAKFTGRENLDFFCSMYSGETEDPRELLAMVGLEKHGDTRVEKWSKGMKMRLNFVRALLNKPDVLFLDEPTTGLDPANARNIKNIILSFKEAGKAVFITTHNMEVAESICDRLAFIVDGELVLTDSPVELKLRMGQPRVNEYLAAKALSLGAISTASSLLIIVAGLGRWVNPMFVVFAVFLTAMFFTLAGFTPALQFKSLPVFLVLSPLYIVVFNLPVMHYLGLVDSVLFYLLPTTGALFLIDGSLTGLSAGQVLYSLFILALWVLGAWHLAWKALARYIIRGGEGKA